MKSNGVTFSSMESNGVSHAGIVSHLSAVDKVSEDYDALLDEVVALAWERPDVKTSDAWHSLTKIVSGLETDIRELRDSLQTTNGAGRWAE